MPCIYCLRTKEGKQPKAHIFPESIFGDHDELVLRNGEVCGDCNHSFSRLESRFKKRLGLIPLIVGPGVNKKGRPTTVDLPGLVGTRDPRDPRISLNLTPRPWTLSDGRKVQPALKPGERIEFAHAGQGPDGYHFRLAFEMRVDSVFVRILAKIAFETVCLHRGPDYCADLRWRRVREFIRDFEGDRTYSHPKTLTMPTRPDGTVSVPVGVRLEPVEVRVSGPWEEQWVILIRVGPTFVIDMSTENDLLVNVLQVMPEDVQEGVFLKTCRGKSGVGAT